MAVAVTLRERITRAAENDGYTVIFYDGFDDAIVGLATRFDIHVPVVLYDRAKCISILMEQNKWSVADAEEFFSFNTEGLWAGEETPIFLHHVPEIVS